MDLRDTLYARLDMAREPYMRIHKRPVGPKTAERLFLHYIELSEFQDPQAMYEAGSAAAEAMLAGTHFNSEMRSDLVYAAATAWQYALELQTERAADNAEARGREPDRTAEFRIAAAMSRIPILEDLVDKKPTKDTLRNAQRLQLMVTQEAVAQLESAQEAGWQARAGNYLGLCNELLAICATDRLQSARIIAFPSNARADSGYPYPKQTHDIQILSFDGPVIRQVTPLESKNRLRPGHSMRYEAALLGGEQHLLASGLTHGEAVHLMTAEADGHELSSEDTRSLSEITDSVIHVVRHWHRAKDFGRHCLNNTECRIAPRPVMSGEVLSA